MLNNSICKIFIIFIYFNYIFYVNYIKLYKSFLINCYYLFKKIELKERSSTRFYVMFYSFVFSKEQINYQNFSNFCNIIFAN